MKSLCFFIFFLAIFSSFIPAPDRRSNAVSDNLSKAPVGIIFLNKSSTHTLVVNYMISNSGGFTPGSLTIQPNGQGDLYGTYLSTLTFQCSFPQLIDPNASSSFKILGPNGSMEGAGCISFTGASMFGGVQLTQCCLYTVEIFSRRDCQ